MNSPDWQPIATAPKNGTKFLAYRHVEAGKSVLTETGYPAYDEFAVVWWEVSKTEDLRPVEGGLFQKVERVVCEGFISGWYRNFVPDSMTPTHWMPLPKPPES